MASNLIAMASNLNSDGLQPNSDGLAMASNLIVPNSSSGLPADNVEVTCFILAFDC